MTAKREKPPAPMVRLSRGVLSPVSGFDAEDLAKFPDGALFDLVHRNKRTLPLHRTYWRTLSHVVQATGRWASPEALHTALKCKMGLLEPIFDLSGNVTGMMPHSTAFGAMDQSQFKAYFDGCMAHLSQAVGFDVLAWLEEGR